MLKYYFYKRFFLLFALFVISIAGASMSHAQPEEDKDGLVNWELHRSATGTFDVKFPQEYKYNLFPFLYNEERVAFSGQIVSTLDGTAVNKDKSIIVKTSQTFGERLTQRQIKRILKRESDRYKASVGAIGGKVVSDEDYETKGIKGKNLYITYDHNNEKYGIRIRLFVTDYSRIEQVLTGPASTMYSFRAEDFFNSLVPARGITKYEGDKKPGYGWITYPSQNNVFSVKLPPKNADYTPRLPKFEADEKTDSIKFEIFDPVLEESAYYHTYSYKAGRQLAYNDVKSILFSNHISRFVSNASIDNLDVDHTRKGNINVMRTRLVISPIKRYPHVSVVVIEAQYKDDIVMVKEFFSNSSHSLSKLHETLFRLTEFHPEKFKPSITE